MKNQSDMDSITRHLTTKSDKIRRLGAAGYPRQAIADFLGIRYQHVRNVLVDEARKTRSGFSEGPGPEGGRPLPLAPGSPGKAVLRADGSVALPAAALAAAGFKDGDTLFVRAAGEGEIYLLSSRAAIRRAQDLVREFVPENVSLVDELLKERRREAAKENE
jgi:antitoxin component of MazEF toxin-antitoxin module